MSNLLSGLSERIQTEIVEIGRVLERIQEGWKRARSSADDYYLDSVALNLHGFYSGFERIFELIAGTIDGDIPKGENWHQALLLQMTQDIPGIRPAVISKAIYTELSEYRGFRHIVRNVYTYHFDPDKIEKLVVDAIPVFAQIKTELLAFAGLLRSL
jgi:hypothetical protein